MANAGPRRTPTSTDAGQAIANLKPALHQSLLLKQALFVSAVVLLTTATLGWVSYGFAQNTLSDLIHNRLRLVVTDRRAMLQMYVAHQHERAALLANGTRLRQLIQSFESGKVDRESFRQESTEVLLQAKSNSDGVKELWIADAGGKIVAATDLDRIGDDLSNNPDFLRGRSERRLIAPSNEEGQFHAVLSAPILSDAETAVGVIGLLLDFGALHDLLAQPAGLGETGDVVVCRRAGDRAEFLLPPRGQRENTTSLANVPVLADALDGRVGFRTGTYHGVEVLSVFEPVELQSEDDAPWVLVAMLEANEAFRPIARLRRILLPLQVILLLAGVLVSFIIARRVARPILQLSDMAASVAGGNFDARTSLQSNDEIGLLARAFNAMTAKLAGSYAALEQTIQGRTAELSQKNQALIREMSDRERAEETLRQSEARFRTMTETIPAMVGIFQGTKQVYANAAATTLTGYSRDELLEMSFLQIIHPDFREFVHARSLARQRGEAVPPRYEVKIRTKSGEERWIDFSAAMIDYGGKPAVLGVSFDITEKKFAEAALNEAKNSAVAASRAKGDFLAHMSHEIRTPLNAVIGMTELVLDTPLSTLQADYLKMVRDASESLLAIISDVLDFSKIEAGKLELDCREFDLREALGDAIKSLAYTAHDKDLELIVRFDPRLPKMVVGDVGRLRQVAINLVGNAVKFTQSGEVSVDVKQESSTADDVVVHITVSDTGIGIPEAKLATIFGAFEQADSSTTRRFGGTGLGLAISSKLVQLMGGTIWCESHIGQGSHFHAMLKLGRSDADVEAKSVSSTNVRNARVLVVDDNTTSRRVLEEIARNIGVSPVAVATAHEAIDKLRESEAAGEPIPVALVDAGMPEVDGFALSAEIKNDEQLDSAIIMMMTGRHLLDESLRSGDTGIAAYLTKPLKESELRDAILRALGDPAARQPRAAAGPDAAAEPHRSLRILLAEDSLFNQKLAQGQLQKAGHRVTIVNNGIEAVAAVAAEKFDAVLMDVQMPVMDGLQAAAAIRRQEAQSGGHTPIIAMTAHVTQDDHDACLAAGMDGYVGKPVRAADLQRALSESISEK